MSEHRVSLEWKRDAEDFSYVAYTRDHTWTFPGGIAVEASAAPKFLGSAELVDPEQAFVASLSSCHMLTLLAIASRRGFVVDSYRDEAMGVLEKNEAGRLALTRVTLRPRIAFSGEKQPSPEQLDGMHERAHQECFLANSVKTHITVAGS